MCSDTKQSFEICKMYDVTGKVADFHDYHLNVARIL